jgi:DNA-binding FadR family transcriptional regulator
MEAAARMGDARASLRADLELHRAIRRAANNEVAGALWDAIARHVVIIFSLESYRDEDLAAVARQHASLREVILDQIRRPGSEEELRRAVEDHFLQVASAKARGGRRGGRLAR